jgi:hypothetical protein
VWPWTSPRSTSRRRTLRAPRPAPSVSPACATVVVETAGWLIKPPPGHDRFFELNIGIHGIRPEDVVDAPTWVDQLTALDAFIGDDVVVAHNAGFDMSVLRRACEATDAACPPYRYLCSLQVAARPTTSPRTGCPRRRRRGLPRLRPPRRAPMRSRARTS